MNTFKKQGIAMSEAIIAKRYADALFQLSSEKNVSQAFLEEFKVIRDVFQENPKLTTFLKHPRINNDKKRQFLIDTFQGFQADVVNTLQLIVKKHHVDAVPHIVDHFTTFINDASSIAEGTVYSVREL